MTLVSTPRRFEICTDSGDGIHHRADCCFHTDAVDVPAITSNFCAKIGYLYGFLRPGVHGRGDNTSFCRVLGVLRARGKAAVAVEHTDKNLTEDGAEAATRLGVARDVEVRFLQEDQKVDGSVKIPLLYQEDCRRWRAAAVSRSERLQQRGEESIRVRQHIRVLYHFLGREPEDFVHFQRIGGQRRGGQLSEPAPQGEGAFRKVVVPDALLRNDVCPKLFVHFPDGRSRLRLAVVDPATGETDAEWRPYHSIAPNE